MTMHPLHSNINIPTSYSKLGILKWVKYDNNKSKLGSCTFQFYAFNINALEPGIPINIHSYKVVKIFGCKTLFSRKSMRNECSEIYK